jgi:hypothetical protein
MPLLMVAAVVAEIRHRHLLADELKYVGLYPVPILIYRNWVKSLVGTRAALEHRIQAIHGELYVTSKLCNVIKTHTDAIKTHVSK